MVASPNQLSATERASFWLVLALFVALEILVHAGAALFPLAATAAGDPCTPPLDRVLFSRIIFSIWATVVLVTPALGLRIFARGGGPEGYWRAFWTFAFLAFLVHAFWTVIGTFHGDLHEVFNSHAGETCAEKIVQQPTLDFVLMAWWGLDVVLAWVASEGRWIRLQRDAVHVLAFVIFLAASVKGSTVVRGLGIAMAVSVLACLALRLFGRRNHPNPDRRGG